MIQHIARGDIRKTLLYPLLSTGSRCSSSLCSGAPEGTLARNLSFCCAARRYFLLHRSHGSP